MAIPMFSTVNQRSGAAGIGGAEPPPDTQATGTVPHHNSEHFMTITNVFSVLSGFPRKLIEGARNAIIFVRSTQDHLPGSLQHMAAVEMLVGGFPNLPKWAAHSVIGATFGWLEKHMPDRLLPVLGTLQDDLTKAADAVIDDALVTPSPFAVTAAVRTDGGAEPPPDTLATGTVPLGESSPPQAATPQRPALQPLAPVGS